jgi:hypothetical protein
MFRFKTRHLFVLLGLAAPLSSFAASNYCIAVGGGFGSGGTTFIGSGFVVPAAGTCTGWSGFTKTASSVIMMTRGNGCLSSDGKLLTVSVSSADPSFLGSGQIASDYIQLCPAGATGCPIGGGRDNGAFGGAAQPVTCSASLLKLPAIHD